MSRLQRLGISTRQGTHAPILLDAYRHKYALQPEDFPNAVLADSLSMAMPLAPQMSQDDVAAVVEELRCALDAG